jgi:hypothetical protein
MVGRVGKAMNYPETKEKFCKDLTGKHQLGYVLSTEVWFSTHPVLTPPKGGGGEKEKCFPPWFCEWKMNDHEYGELVEWHWQGKTRVLKEKLLPVPFFSTTSQSKVQNQAQTDRKVNVFGEIIAY